MTGLEPVPVAVDAGGLDIDALAGHDVDAVLLAPAHSYPSGGTLDARRRRDLIDWARRHDALVIEDDYDAEFRYDRVPIGACKGSRQTTWRTSAAPARPSAPHCGSAGSPHPCH
jgi:GntR family transcriptional regulator/MocR family aminotransferase